MHCEKWILFSLFSHEVQERMEKNGKKYETIVMIKGKTQPMNWIKWKMSGNFSIWKTVRSGRWSFLWCRMVEWNEKWMKRIKKKEENKSREFGLRVCMTELRYITIDLFTFFFHFLFCFFCLLPLRETKPWIISRLPDETASWIRDYRIFAE